MKLGEKKKNDLYEAISRPITDERIFLANTRMSAIAYDDRLFNLEQEIWRRVHNALNLDGPI